jgi:hypothetical protein
MKHSHLDALDADVLVVQECENPAESAIAYREWAGKYLWKGMSKNKGIGVFPKKGHKVAETSWTGSFDAAGIASKSPAARWCTEDLELFLPFTLDAEYTVLGVPTFFLHHNTAKPYHIDYVFASRDFLPHCNITVGQVENWLDQSDHMPLILEF